MKPRLWLKFSLVTRIIIVYTSIHGSSRKNRGASVRHTNINVIYIFFFLASFYTSSQQRLNLVKGEVADKIHR